MTPLPGTAGATSNVIQSANFLMPTSLRDKIVLVTGGSSGIGRATALAAHRQGAKAVIVADLNNGPEGAVAKIKSVGGEALFIQTDVSKPAEVQTLMSKVLESYGRIDCAVNNAGIEGAMASTADCTEENWDRIMAINLKGIWLCMKYEIPPMLKQGTGAIVNMSSVLGLVGLPGYAAYAASKHGVAGLTKTAALEYAPAGIRVNAVCPGATRTPLLDRMIGGKAEVEAWLLSKEPIGRLGNPEEIAEAAVWLCSGAASFVTGHTLTVDGGVVAQ
jgi:NAD(P)-dependent dehydrogenase (short-subunit alcohol dehydrogenase family)